MRVGRFFEVRGDDGEIEPVRLTFKEVEGRTEWRVWYSDGSWGGSRLGPRKKADMIKDFERVKATRKDRERAREARHAARRRNASAE